MSKKRAGIGLVPIEFEIGRQAAAKGAQTLQQFSAPGPARDAELLAIGDINFNLVALLEARRFDDNGGEPDGKTVAPFRDLHEHHPEGYT